MASPARSFVGRTRELDELRTELAGAVSGQGRLILVSGEPGIGKTRLAEELGDHARAAGALVLWGGCLEGEGALAFWPWVQVIRKLSESLDAAELAAHLGAGAAYVSGVVPEIADRLGSAPRARTSPESEHARFHLFDAITSLLKKASRVRPLLVVLDDLHWADRSSLLLLEFVARDLRDARILAIGTYREGEVRSDVALAEMMGGLVRAGRSFPLRGLSEAEVGLLMEKTGRRRPDARLVAAVHRSTDGNPFFVDEIVRLLAAEGITQDHVTERLPIPEGVRAAIRRRLSHVPGELRELLSIGTVIGREFDVAVLERVSGRSPSEILGSFAAATDAGLLTGPPTARGRWVFAHDVIRETIYHDLPLPERIRLHRRIGETLEALHAGDPEAHVAELAHHFLEAAADGDAAKAIDYSERAGHRAFAVHAYDEAARHFDRALQMGSLGKIDETRRCELWLALGRALNPAGDLERSSRALRYAVDLARKLGLSTVIARAALDFGRFLGGDPERMALLAEAIESLPPADSVLRARVMTALAVAQLDADDPSRTIPLIEEAAAIAGRVGDPWTVARTIVARHQIHWLLPTLEGRSPPPFDDSREVEELGDLELELELRAIRIKAYLSSADVEGARREVAAFSRAAGELRQPWREAMAKGLRANLDVLDGRFAEAERLFDEGRHEGGGYLLVQHWVGSFSTLRKLQGRFGEVGEILEANARFYPGSMALRWRAARAAVLAELGRENEARRELESLARADFADLPRGRFFLNSLAYLSETCAFVGDQRRAALLYGLLHPFAGQGVCFAGSPAAVYGDASHYLGLLATTLAQWDDAERHFGDAVAAHEKMGARPWAALTRFHWAKMLRTRNDAGDRERASCLLDGALATAEELGMKAVAERARALRVDAGALASPLAARVPFGGAGVTEPPGRGFAASEPSRLCRQGRHWTISHEGVVFRLKDSKGLRTIAHLLRHPGLDCHVMDLVAVAEGKGPDAGNDTAEVAAQGLRVGGLGDAGGLLDPRAKAAYRARLDELRNELQDAERSNDIGRTETARREIEFLTEELSRAVGLGGRDRKAAAATERARFSVTRACRGALDKIAELSPSLHAHLSGAIHTGTYCSYRPRPGDPVRWAFDPQ